MPYYTIYNVFSGKISKMFSFNDLDAVFANLDENEGFIEGFCDINVSIVDLISREIVSRLENPVTIDKETLISDNVDKIIISGLYDNCRVVYKSLINNQLFTPTELPVNYQLEFKIDTPGIYEIEITGFPYLPKTFTVTAT